MPKYLNLRLDEETYWALRRLADYEQRSMSKQVNMLIRQAALERNLWLVDFALKSVKKTTQ